jgi:hypothetical protein
LIRKAFFSRAQAKPFNLKGLVRIGRFDRGCIGGLWSPPAVVRGAAGQLLAKPILWGATFGVRFLPLAKLGPAMALILQSNKSGLFLKTFFKMRVS